MSSNAPAGARMRVPQHGRVTARFEFYELPPEVKDKIAVLRAEMAANLVLLAGYRLGALLAKANFNPNQPRAPRGQQDGGRWVDTGRGFAGRRRQPHGPPPKPKLEVPLRGIGDNGGPPLEEPPKIPREPPLTREVRNAILKQAAKWLLKASLRSAAGPIGHFLTALDVAYWMYDNYPYLQAYLDEPKSLGELQRAVGETKKGYDVHHVVEETSAKDAGFPEARIQGHENRVRIPTLKHWEITGWFQTANDAFGGLTPREYLRDPKISWEERVRIGHDAIVKFGVMKP